LVEHPLAQHIVTHLRDRTTKPATYRTLTYQLGILLAIEATRDLATVEKAIETPLEPTAGGLAMAQPFLDLFPDATVGYIGLERDHATAIARKYYCKLPPLAGLRAFIVDPMLATGGSAVQALSLLKQHGAVRPAIVCIVAAPEGLAEVEKHHPGVSVVAAALDRTLDAKKYILPGLGDFGDRLYGT
jgi:uracil phosphoribosyltransferase